MKPKEDYYKVLQVDPSAEPEVITAAYRRLAFKYHPDTNKSPEAEARMRQINEAYEVLSNPVRRAAFDRARQGLGFSAEYNRPANGNASTVDPKEYDLREAELERNRAVRAAEDAYRQAIRNADIERDRALREAETEYNRAKRNIEEAWKRARRDADIERDRLLKEAEEKFARAKRAAQAPVRRTWSPSEL
ncbi:MAG: DnaJ domain-containing protein [Anaerolineae bacterium]|nr:DnaJ domain-containing protein [Thermoflexales bacterium]MDW8407621.1 DnaJ domain-containing protein [Anaerolineae bacterium]